MTEHFRRSCLHNFFQFLEWLDRFLIPIFCSYDDSPSLTTKTLLHHWISISEDNSIIRKLIFFILDSVNGLCFEKPKHSHAFSWTVAILRHDVIFSASLGQMKYQKRLLVHVMWLEVLLSDCNSAWSVSNKSSIKSATHINYSTS
jgi:hypothetical protein